MNDASSEAVAGHRQRPHGHPPVKSGRIGVLIANLGTPDATDYWSMRRYLKEFLSDKRVIEENSLTWKLVFNLIILTRRPARQGPRLRFDLEPGAERIAAQDHHPLAEREAFRVACAGGRPDRGRAGACATAIRRSASAIDALMAKGCDRILYVPLYPQYAAATTATACDAAFAHLATMRYQPTLRVAPPYYDDPVYIDAVAASIREELAKLAVQARRDPRILPRHPAANIRQGRSIYCSNAPGSRRLLRKALGLRRETRSA